MLYRGRIFALVMLCLSAAGGAQPVVVGESHSLRSSVLSEERTYRVHLPDSYASNLIVTTSCGTPQR